MEILRLIYPGDPQRPLWSYCGGCPVSADYSIARARRYRRTGCHKRCYEQHHGEPQGPRAAEPPHIGASTRTRTECSTPLRCHYSGDWLESQRLREGGEAAALDPALGGIVGPRERGDGAVGDEVANSRIGAQHEPPHRQGGLILRIRDGLVDIAEVLGLDAHGDLVGVD